MSLSGTKKTDISPISIRYHRFKGTDMAEKFIRMLKTKRRPVLVYFDPDIDGLIAGFLVCRYLKSKGIDFVWKLNQNRGHGFKIPFERLKGLGIDIIAVDFKISSKEVKGILKSGSNILNIDHHLNGDEFIGWGYGGKIGLVINNQYPFEDEDSRYLSGAGVVFEVLREIDKDFDTVENRALVGLTLLSDVRNIENNNAKGYLIDLYTHKYKGYIGYLIDGTKGEKDYGVGVPRLDRNYVDYVLSPTINSCLRFNQNDMVMNFILGSGYIDKSFKAKQRDLVNEMMKVGKMKDFDSLRVVTIWESDFEGSEYFDELSNFIGLVASRYLDGKHSVIACLLKTDGTFRRASFRGYLNGGLYIGSMNATGLIYGEGHESAFGVIWMDLSERSCKELDRVCCEVDKSYRKSSNVVYVENMSVFSSVKGYNIGVENMFCLSQNRTWLKYTGSKIVRKFYTSKYTEYELDGIQVKCFDPDLDPRKDLILPMCERGYVFYYLQKEDSEESIFED